MRKGEGKNVVVMSTYRAVDLLELDVRKPFHLFTKDVPEVPETPHSRLLDSVITFVQHILLLLVSFLTYSSNLKVEEICLSVTSASLRITRLYNSEDLTVHNYRCENLKSNIHWGRLATESRRNI
jgi:hypothetical protein